MFPEDNRLFNIGVYINFSSFTQRYFIQFPLLYRNSGGNANAKTFMEIIKSSLWDIYQNMGIIDDIHEDIGIIKSEPFLGVWLVLGIFLVLSGSIILSTPISNLQIGFPIFALGIACSFFGINRYYNIKSAKKLDEINEKLKKLDIIENLLKNCR